MDRIQLRRDSSARWAEINPILLEGEVGYEIDTKLRKIGDGVNRWNDLEYLRAEGISQETGNNQNITMSQDAITRELNELGSKIGNYMSKQESLINRSGQWLVEIGVQKNIRFVINVSSYSGTAIAQIHNYDFGAKINKILNIGENVLEYEGDGTALNLVINIDGSLTADIFYEYGDKSNIKDINDRLDLMTNDINGIKPNLDILDDKINKVEVLTTVINAKPIVEHGIVINGSTNTLSENTILSYTESIVVSKSVIKAIKFEPTSIGEYKFGIGVIDWRNWGIIRETFVINVTDTSVTTYDVSDNNILIDEGETVFIYIDNGKGLRLVNNSNTTAISKKDEDNVFRKMENLNLVDSINISAGPNQGLYAMQLEEGRYRFVFSNINTTGDFNYGIQELPSGVMLFRSDDITGDSFEVSVKTTSTLRGILNIASGVTASLKMEVYKLESQSVTFQWQIVPYTSIFADKKDVDELRSSVDTAKEQANTAYNNIGVVYDDLGYPFKLSIINGQVVAKAINLYKNIVFIGNSLIEGFNDQSFGSYGMAATVYSNDFCELVMKEIRKRDDSARYTRCSGSSFEQNLFTDEASFDNMTSRIPKDADLIIIRLGENVRNVSSIQTAFIALIKYLKKTFTQSTIVMTSTVLNYSSAYNEPLKAAAVSEDIKYIDIDGSNYNTEMIGISRMYYQQGAFKPSYFAIQTHSNDFGFLKIANAILAAINYKKLDIAHNINTSSLVMFDAPKQGVEDGWVTIKTYDNVKPNISVVDTNGASIEVQHFDLSGFTYDKRFRDGVTEDTATYASVFKMPNSDVSITIR